MPRNIFSFRNLLLLTVPFLSAAAVVWKFFLVFQAPFRLDYAEGFIFTNTLSLVRGASMYHSVESAPYIFGFYTPLYNYIGAIFLKIFGSTPSVLRFLSFVFFVAAGILVGYLVKKTTKNVFASILSALLFYSSFIVSQWSSIVRPDMLGLFFITLGIVVALSKTEKSFARIFLIAAIFSLAFFSKQYFIFAPLAFFISLLFVRKNDAWKFAGAYAFCISVGILLLHFLTHGEFTKQIFVYTSAATYGNFSTAFRIAALTCFSALPFVIVALKHLFQNPKNFFSLYFVCSLVTFFMILRDGGIQNYLLEFVLALLLLALEGFQWEKIQSMSARFFYPLSAAIIFFFILWSYAAFPWETKTYMTERKNVFQNEISSIPLSSSILVEDPFVAYATSSTVELDPYTFGQVSQSGIISSSELFSDIKKGKYQFIDDYTAFHRIPGMLDLIDTYFVPKLQLRFSKQVKPFDYSLYNRNVITQIGTLYQYNTR